MPEESATPDLVELTPRAVSPGNHRDLAAATSFYAAEDEARAAAERLAEERA